MDTKFLLRKNTGDQPIAAEAELREFLQKGQCRPADSLFDFATGKWGRVGDHPSLAPLFAEKPAGAPDRRVIYFLAPGAPASSPQGPFSTKEIQARAQLREICASTWVFVEGDKEWRQVRNVKILHDMLPALPSDTPAKPSAAPPPAVAAPVQPETAGGTPSGGTPALGIAAIEPGGATPPPFKLDLGTETSAPLPPKPETELPSNPSIKLDLGLPASASATAEAPPPAPSLADDDEPHVEREEVTMALDTMGLKLHSQHATLPAAPPAPPRAKPPGLPGAPGAAPSAPPPAPPRASAPPSAPQAGGLSVGSNPAIPKPREEFDGIVAEIPADPVWLIKQANSETVSGPFRFLEIMEFLEQGRLTKNDKIARAGTKAFVKIAQQYEFNVKYSIETVMENGQEKQKILIRRRHPRVPYITGVQIVSKHGLLAGQCVNISAGGILMEIPKAEFNLGDIIDIKILPGPIAKAISCRSLIIGKIPKIPPGYALKFEDLKQEDKEAIEFYVQETLKREMSKKN